MTQRLRIATVVFVGAFLLYGSPARSADNVVSLATEADLDGAVAKALGQEAAARRTITTLLQRDDVRKIAEGRGLDLQQAAAAVGTLQGEELQRLSALAAGVEGKLAGGDQVISISLVTLLLIVIIIILLA
jgi:hypothetical protein